MDYNFFRIFKNAISASITSNLSVDTKLTSSQTTCYIRTAAMHVLYHCNESGPSADLNTGAPLYVRPSLDSRAARSFLVSRRRHGLRGCGPRAARLRVSGIVGILLIRSVVCVVLVLRIVRVFGVRALVVRSSSFS